MMCWESLDYPEQTSQKRKMHAQDDETNNNANEMDNKTPTMVAMRTTNMVKHLNIPVSELRLGADNDTSTLATQETPMKNLVYITNMPERHTGNRRKCMRFQ